MTLKKKWQFRVTINISLHTSSCSAGSIWETKKRLAFLSDAFRSGFVRKIQITRVSRSNWSCSWHDRETVLLRPSSLAISPSRFYNEHRGIRGSLFSVLTSFHRVRDSNSSSFCCRTGGRGRARISAKIGERALGDTSLDLFWKKKKSSVEGGISRGMSTRCNLIAYREASLRLIDVAYEKRFYWSIENIVPYIKCLMKKLSRCVVF